MAAPPPLTGGVALGTRLMPSGPEAAQDVVKTRQQTMPQFRDVLGLGLGLGLP